MKVCIVGLGSIGIQHLSNLHYILSERGEAPHIDAVRTRNHTLPAETRNLLTDIYTTADEAPDDYDIVFITNPTSMHYDTIAAMINKTRHMFIEKPVFDKPDYAWKTLPWKKESIYYVACPLRYSSVINYMYNLTQKKHVFSARCICSSYLPDWRPYNDYKECYSAKAEMGGGVRLDLIHEWDYICHLFGVPTGVAEFHGTFSDLKINSEDLAVYIAEYPDRIVSIHLDYIGRKTRREVELYVEDDVVVGDIANQCIRFLKSGEVKPLPQKREKMQQDEIMCFLDMIDGKCKNHNPVNQALQTLEIALGCVPS